LIFHQAFSVICGRTAGKYNIGVLTDPQPASPATNKLNLNLGVLNEFDNTPFSTQFLLELVERQSVLLMFKKPVSDDAFCQTSRTALSGHHMYYSWFLSSSQVVAEL